VDAELKRVGLTLSPSLVKGGPLPPPLPTGSVVQQAKVCRIDPGLGMLMRASAVVDGKTLARTAYVHVRTFSSPLRSPLEVVLLLSPFRPLFRPSSVSSPLPLSLCLPHGVPHPVSHRLSLFQLFHFFDGD
jgi:hypothetical protein